MDLLNESLVAIMMYIVSGTMWLGDIVKQLTIAPQDFFATSQTLGNVTVTNEEIYNTVVLINETVRVTVGYPVLAIFFLIELLNKLISFDNMNYKIIIKTMLKFAIAKIVLDNTLQITEWIFAISSELAIAITSAVSTDFATVDKDVTLATIEQMVKDTNIFVKYYLMIAVGFMAFLMFLTNMLIKLVVFGRIIILFIYTALAPIPLATFSSEQFSQTGKRFLQKFVGVCFRSSAMIIVLIIYQKLIGNQVVMSFVKNPGDFILQGLSYIIITIALGILLFKTSGITNDLVGA